MLVAEIHGKRVDDARDSEDYLTSAVFGHLRYVPPGSFWDDLLKRASGLPGPGGREPSLGRLLTDSGSPPSAYARLKVYFWRQHEAHGEPDLLLVFAAGDRPPLVVLVEVKLGSKKSGTGDRDQLVRYLRVLEDLDGVGVNVPAEAVRYLIYLTPGESLVEADDSAACVDEPSRDRPRLFRLQWQDLLEAADAAWPGSAEPTCTILADVARFLRELGLEYFKGMSRLDELPLLDPDFGNFYSAGLTGFRGVTRDPVLDLVEVCKGRWA